MRGGRTSSTIVRALASVVGREQVLDGQTRNYLRDATELRGLEGHADAIVLPRSAEQAAAVLGWCYERDVPIVPRGGGTGFAGGSVPYGGVVVSTERLACIRSFEPLLWRIEAEAGVRTADLRSRVRDHGLFFPPDPGAAEQSHIGGNIATNAGGPHAFKYGTTGAWVMGIEVVLPPGELVRLGGAFRKDVSGYDLKRLLIGSEGTLGVITAAWLRLLPAPEAAHPVVAFFATTESGCAGLEAVLGNGIVAAALDYLDDGALALASGSYPGDVPGDARFMLVAEADGSAAEAARIRDELVDVLGEEAVKVETPEPKALWRWREGVSIAVAAARGGKVSEDIEVPLDRLADAIRGTVEIGRRHGLEAMSWGHAGDGNVHATFLVSRDDREGLALAEEAASDVFDLTLTLGGSISGEHGLGSVKRGHAGWPTRIEAIHAQVKATFDPKGLLNPGKKL